MAMNMGGKDWQGNHWTINNTNMEYIFVCYEKPVAMRGGIWRPENPLMSSVPTLIIQLVSVMFINHVLMLAFKPLHQPRIVADILGGVLLGPSGFGQFAFSKSYISPFNSALTLDTVANLGLVYFVFLLGLEFDFKPVIRAGKKALSIAIVGVAFCMPLGWALHYYLFVKDFAVKSKNKPTKNGPIFWGIALATTNFKDLARILADLKLLHSQIGRISLSAAIISDLFSGFFLLVATAVVNRNHIYAVGSTLTFIGICVFLVRPILSWAIRSTTKEDKYNELHTCFVLVLILVFGFISDACGSHSVVGPFVLGAIMPKGDLKNMLVERIENFVSGIMMPLFFLVIGLRTNCRHIFGDASGMHETSIYRIVGVIIVTFAAKILSTFVVAVIHKMSFRDSMALGVLMNTKGLLALITLDLAKDLKVLNNQTFSIMVVSIWVMTIAVGPFLALTYKSTKRSMQCKHKSIRSIGHDRELRILACTHTSSNVSGIINLLEASNPTRQFPICVFSVHLVELTGPSSAMLIVHDACKTRVDHANERQSNLTSNAFENYAKQRESVSVQELTVVSAYSTMHEDICNLAEEKNVDLIIVPFHKQSTIDGAMEDSNPDVKGVNNNVIENAMCSVGVFVDRGLGVSKITESNKNSMGRLHFAVLFTGGADDREALAYAWRMAGHPKINLTVVRFILCKEVAGVNPDNEVNERIVEEEKNTTERQKQLDVSYMDKFRLGSMNNPSIKLLEELVSNWEDTLKIISSMEGEYDLYIVGRRQGNLSAQTAPVTKTILDSKDSDDLGPLGEELVSSVFTANTSILIVQHGGSVDELDA